MKVRVSMPGAYMAVEMDEERAYRMFRKMVELLCISGTGSVTKLENLVPLYMNCECGRNARYLTNMEEPVFDITCYDCGNPVPTAWNPKKKQYETIRG